jgi:hypothetical protein
MADRTDVWKVDSKGLGRVGTMAVERVGKLVGWTADTKVDLLVFGLAVLKVVQMVASKEYLRVGLSVFQWVGTMAVERVGKLVGWMADTKVDLMVARRGEQMAGWSVVK